MVRTDAKEQKLEAFFPYTSSTSSTPIFSGGISSAGVGSNDADRVNTLMR